MFYHFLLSLHEHSLEIRKSVALNWHGYNRPEKPSANARTHIHGDVTNAHTVSTKFNLFHEIQTFVERLCLEFPLGTQFSTFSSLRTRIVPFICVLFPYLSPCISYIQINTAATQHIVHINGMCRRANKPLFAVQYRDSDFQQLLWISDLKPHQCFPTHNSKTFPLFPMIFMYAEYFLQPYYFIRRWKGKWASSNRQIWGIFRTFWGVSKIISRKPISFDNSVNNSIRM